MTTYTILKDGDRFEQKYWTLFMSSQFPTYEKYWATKIVPLTNRPTNIHFKRSTDLLSAGYTAENICNAQLHYTTFRQLVRAFEILKHLKNGQPTIFDLDLLSEGLFHICGAQDVAFEFLQRNKTPNTYDPWAAKKQHSATRTKGSKEAREQWQRDNSYPLQDIRDYRNHLTHGRMSPSIMVTGKMKVPKISKQDNYLDWRIITDGNPLTTPSDFDDPDIIMQDAWDRTLTYLETQWSRI